MIPYGQFLQRWDQALRWNSLLFILSQCGKTITSWILFYQLSSTDYMQLANLQCLVYLAVSLLDGGLSRTLPHYSLLFSGSRKRKSELVSHVLWCKFFLVLILSGLGLWLFEHQSMLYLGILLFIAESMRGTVRHFFYAYLWHKRFNMVEAAIVLIRTIGMLIASLTITCAQQVIFTIVVIEIGASILIVAASFVLVPKLLQDRNYRHAPPLNQPSYQQFLLHSGVMWISSSLPMVSGRNVLVPFFYALAGPEIASLFKVANDLAIMLQRFVTKTIGSADSSLFSHAHTQYISSDRSAQFLTKQLWERFNRRLLQLTAPLLALALVIFYYLSLSSSTPLVVAQLFLLLSVGYLLQNLLIGYRRVVEVAHRYRIIFWSMVPHLLLTALLVWVYWGSTQLTVNMVMWLVLIVHLVRFMSAVICRIGLSMEQVMPYPRRYALQMGACCILAASTVCVAHMHLGHAGLSHLIAQSESARHFLLKTLAGVKASLV